MLVNTRITKGTDRGLFTVGNLIGQGKSAGDKYVGEFKDGHFGYGTYTFAKGHKYVGEHKDGKEHGQGIHYRADGTVLQEGIFENGKFLYAKLPT